MKSLSPIYRAVIILILITGTVLRFYHFNAWSLSNDELSALNRLQYNSFSEMIEQGVKLNDMHPAGVQVFLFLWTAIAGISETALRLPFVIMGILSIWIFFLVAKRWIGTGSALPAAAAFSTLIFPILYSQLARPYSPGLLFSLAAVYCWSNIVFKEGSTKSKVTWGYYAGFVLSCLACMYTHYFAFLFVGLVGITGLFLVKGRERIQYILAGILMLLLFIPGIPVLKYQMSIGGLGGEQGWLGPPEKDVWLKLLQFIFNDSSWLLIFFTLLLIISLILSKWNKTSRSFRSIALIFFIVPFCFAFFYSIFKNPIYQHSIMIFSFPYLLLFIFSFLPALNSWKTAFLSLLTLCICSFSTVAEKRFYRTQYFGVFKEVAEEAIAAKEKYGKENVTFVANVIMPYYINYYHAKFNNPVNYRTYSVNTQAGLANLYETVSNSRTSYISYGWSNTAYPGETDQIIMQFFPYVIRKVNHFNSGYRLYSRTDEPGSKRPEPAFTFKHDFESRAMENDSAMLSQLQQHSGHNSILYNPENEFGPAFKRKLSEIHAGKGSIIWMQLWVNTEHQPASGTLVLQIDHDGKNILWAGADIKEYARKEKWSPVFLTYEFTGSISSDATLTAYFWNSGKQKIYIDDFSIQVMKSPLY